MMLRILFGVLTTLLLNNCSNKNTVSQFDLDVLAQVGNKIITKQDFIRRAEYTLGQIIVDSLIIHTKKLF